MESKRTSPAEQAWQVGMRRGGYLRSVLSWVVPGSDRTGLLRGHAGQVEAWFGGNDSRFGRERNWPTAMQASDMEKLGTQLRTNTSVR